MAFGLIFFSLAGASAQSWVQLVPTGQAPDAASNMNSVYDAADNEMIVFGGGFIPRNNTTTLLSNADGLAGTPAWTVLSVNGTLPPARALHGVVYDWANDVLITYGGYSGSGDFQPLLNDLWALANASGQRATSAWAQLLPTGGPPPPRADFSAVYDPVSNRMIVFGDCTGPNSSACNTALNDTWVLTNANGTSGPSQWIQLNLTTVPATVTRFSMTEGSLISAAPPC